MFSLARLETIDEADNGHKNEKGLNANGKIRP